MPSMVRMLLQVLVFPVLIGQILAGKAGYVYLCVLTLVLMELPRWAERELNVALPQVLESLVLLFVFASEILGEIRACYIRYPVWDLLLHGFSGFLFASIGWVLPAYFGGQPVGKPVRLLFAVCFSMTVGVAWEFLEWGVDMIFGLDMQKDTVIYALRSICLDPRGGNAVGGISGIRDLVVCLADGSNISLGLGGYLDVGLHDTMGDLLVNLAGALVFGAVSRWERLARHLIPVVQSLEER